MTLRDRLAERRQYETPNEWLTVPQVIERTGISRSTIHRTLHREPVRYRLVRRKTFGGNPVQYEIHITSLDLIRSRRDFRMKNVQEPQTVFGETLRAFRSRLGQSSAETARIVGISVGMWSKCELGWQVPTVQTIAKMAEVLGCTGQERLLLYDLAAAEGRMHAKARKAILQGRGQA